MDTAIKQATGEQYLTELKNLGTEDQIVKLPEVMRITHQSRSTIDRLIRKEAFPAPLYAGGHKIGWRLSDVEKWIANL